MKIISIGTPPNIPNIPFLSACMPTYPNLIYS